MPYFSIVQSLITTADFLNNTSSPSTIDVDTKKDKLNGSLVLTNEAVEPIEDIEMKPLNNAASPTLTNPTVFTYDSNGQTPPDCCSEVVLQYFSFCVPFVPEVVKKYWTLLRSKANRLVEHRFFEWLIMASILASSTTLVS